MEVLEFPADDLTSQMDLEAFFNDSPDDTGLLGTDAFNTSSRDWEALSIGEIEDILMKDDEGAVALGAGKEVPDSFFAELLVDSPLGGSGEVVDGSSDKDSDSTNFGSAGVGDKQVDAAEAANDGKSADDPTSKKRLR